MMGKSGGCCDDGSGDDSRIFYTDIYGDDCQTDVHT